MSILTPFLFYTGLYVFLVAIMVSGGMYTKTNF
jgi:hypothetical protein